MVGTPARVNAGFSRLETISAVIGAFAAVIGVVIGIQQLTKPPSDLGGDIIDASIESASPSSVRGQFEIKGFKGKNCDVTATVFHAATREVVPGLADQPVATLKPEADNDRAPFSMPLNLPTVPGQYFVTLVLFDPSGQELDRHETEPIQVGPASTNTYPNSLELALLSHIPNESNSRCQRAVPLGLGDIAGVRCEPLSGATAAWYYQFSDVPRMRAAYESEVARTGILGGTCDATAWTGEMSYPIGTTIGGRMLCYQGTDAREWIEWTNESLAVFARANSPNSRVLLEWWMRAAGPV